MSSRGRARCRWPLRGAAREELSRDGFLAIESLLTDEDLAPVHDEYERILNGRIDRLIADGKLSERPEGSILSVCMQSSAIALLWAGGYHPGSRHLRGRL